MSFQTYNLSKILYIYTISVPELLYLQKEDSVQLLSKDAYY